MRSGFSKSVPEIGRFNPPSIAFVLGAGWGQVLANEGGVRDVHVE